MTRYADLLVIAKQPIAGKVKTRLSPGYSPAEAAELAAAALADTLRTAALVPARRRILILDGEPGVWLPDGFDVIAQRGDGLDERLANAFDDTGGPAVLIGMDTPQVSCDLLSPIMDTHVWDCDAWFGPAADGGFWALGLTQADPGLLLDVPMSRHDTGNLLLQRLAAAGLRVRRLPELRDVDNPEDVDTVAAQAPHGDFAATAARLRRVHHVNGAA